MPTTVSIDAKVKAAPAAELCSSELQWDPWAYDVKARRSSPAGLWGGRQPVGHDPAVGPRADRDSRSAIARWRAKRSCVASRRQRRALGSRLVILGHHYQRDEIIRWADFRGDSFKLSQQAASRREADYIVFCGVHFMAESADILAADHQRVILPNLAAGCSMADMADEAQVLSCWKQLGEALGFDAAPAHAPGGAESIPGRRSRSSRSPT